MAIGFSTSIKGLNAALTSNNVRTNNIANVNSRGFKSKSVRQSESLTGGPNVDIVKMDLTQGSLSFTDNPLDIAIAGRGFIEFENSNGEKLYSRTASLRIDGNGNLVDNQGNKLSGIEHNFTSDENIVIQSDGNIMAIDKEGNTVQVGKIMLANFNNPQGLIIRGNGLYQVSSNSGNAIQANNPNIIQGALENSNVDLATDITGQMIDLASLKANVATIKTQDEMLGEIVDLKG